MPLSLPAGVGVQTAYVKVGDARLAEEAEARESAAAPGRWQLAAALLSVPPQPAWAAAGKRAVTLTASVVFLCGGRVSRMKMVNYEI